MPNILHYAACSSTQTSRLEFSFHPTPDSLSYFNDTSYDTRIFTKEFYMQLYDYSVTSFVRTLTGLKGILEKGKHYADDKKIDFSVLLQTRLVPDQFPLAKQIQIATDTAKLFVSRLSALEAPKFADTETTYDEFQARIQATIDFLKTAKPEDLSVADKKITFPWNKEVCLDGQEYALYFAIPNFYFHVVTAYSILRSCGVNVGKTDYLAGLNWQKV